MIKITNLQNRQSYNCYSGGICYLLERYGVLLSEHVSFGLSAGLNFEINIEDRISFCAVRQLHCLTEYITMLGIEVIENIQDSYENLIIDLEHKINENLPFMVEYDGFYLPFTQIYNKKHEKRICLAIGYTNESIYLSDFIYKVYEYPINKELFKQATDKNLGACIEFKWYDVKFPADINEKITENDIKISILQVANYFLQENENNRTHMTGISGMVTFADNLKDIVLNKKYNLENWLKLSEEMKQYVITLSHYGDFIQDIWGKKLLAIDKKKAELIVALFKKASNRWKLVCNLFFKYGITGQMSNIERINVYIKETADLLEQAFSNLKNELEKV